MGSVPKVHISSSGMSKQNAKLLKHKHKCKITFYLDSEDFEQESDKNLPSSERRKNGLAKVMEGLSRAFGKIKKVTENVQNEERKEDIPVEMEMEERKEAEEEKVSEPEDPAVLEQDNE